MLGKSTTLKVLLSAHRGLIQVHGHLLPNGFNNFTKDGNLPIPPMKEGSDTSKSRKRIQQEINTEWIETELILTSLFCAEFSSLAQFHYG